MEQNKRRTKKKGSGWLGLMLFLAFVVGPQLALPLSRFIVQVSNGALVIPVGMMVPVMIGAVVALSVLGAVARAIFRLGQQTEISSGVELPPGNVSSPAPSRTMSPSSTSAAIAAASAPSMPAAAGGSAARTTAARVVSAAQAWTPTSSGTLAGTQSMAGAASDVSWRDIDALFGTGDGNDGPRSGEIYDLASLRRAARTSSMVGLMGASPRYEPMVNGKVLFWGILLAMVLVVILAIVVGVSMSGLLP